MELVNLVLDLTRVFPPMRINRELLVHEINDVPTFCPVLRRVSHDFSAYYFCGELLPAPKNSSRNLAKDAPQIYSICGSGALTMMANDVKF